MAEVKYIRFVCLTAIFILLAHYLARLPHEYAHSIMAWLLGYKSNPLGITFGDTSLSNILLLTQVNENIDYDTIFSTGHGIHAALIAFAGIGFANIPLFILSLWLLKRHGRKSSPYIFYFFFLFNLMNLGSFYAFVPIKTFATQGDVAVFVKGLHISPWWVYIIGGYIVAFLVWHFLTKSLQSAFTILSLPMPLQIMLMIICLCILFGYYGSLGLVGFGDIAHFLSVTSLIAIPGLIMAMLY